MNSPSLTRAQILLIKSAEDEQALRVEGLSDSIQGFHAQQTVEKLLKALLSQLSIDFELTHDLGRLQVALEAAGETLPSTPLEVRELNDFSVFYRYDLLFQYAVPEREDVLETVRLIREFVMNRIAALTAPPLLPPV
jgi:hypothetical protein